MIGEFTSGPAIKPVEVGQRLKVTLSYSALNPGSFYWKTFLIAYSTELQQELSATREIGEHADSSVKSYWLFDEVTYSPFYMPNATISISFFLFGHDDAGYQWDWDEFYAWGYGASVEIIPLASAYLFLSPLQPGEEALPVLPDYQTVYIPQPEGPPIEQQKPVILPITAAMNWGSIALIGGGSLLIIGSVSRKKRAKS